MEDTRIVHAVRDGYPLCKFTDKWVRNWPTGHEWVGMARVWLEHETDLDNFISCPKCREKAAELVQKMRAILNRGERYSESNRAPLDAPIDILELSTRPHNCFLNDELVTIGDLISKTRAELLRTPNFGRRSLNEVERELERVGRHLGTNIEAEQNPAEAEKQTADEVRDILAEVMDTDRAQQAIEILQSRGYKILKV